MLGGKPPPRDIPERVGYDRVLLGVETLSGEELTLLRSTERMLSVTIGGREGYYEGAVSAAPARIELPTKLSDSECDM